MRDFVISSAFQLHRNGGRLPCLGLVFISSLTVASKDAWDHCLARGRGGLVPAAHICDSAVHFFGEAFFVAFFFVLFLAFFTAFGLVALVAFLVAFFAALGMVRERVWFLPTMLGRCLLRNCVHA